VLRQRGKREGEIVVCIYTSYSHFLSSYSNTQTHTHIHIYSGGLDSFQAQSVMTRMKKLCDDGPSGQRHTVIVSIHQPRSTVYTMFDDIILLSEGQVGREGGREGKVIIIFVFTHSPNLFPSLFPFLTGDLPRPGPRRHQALRLPRLRLPLPFQPQ
jgi:hypothetical protein